MMHPSQGSIRRRPLWPAPGSTLAKRKPSKKRQTTMVDYSKITAPFDGVVTKRYADVGALIQAGHQLERHSASAVIGFAQENVLRTMFPVPESAVSAVQNGAPVQIEVSGAKPHSAGYK